MNILKDKNCFLTGATGGIGKEIAKQLAINGCNLFLTATNNKTLKDLQAELKNINKNITVSFSAADLNSLVEITRVVKAARSILGAIDILVNCAGIYFNKPLAESNVEDFDKLFNINVKASLIFSKEFTKDMIKKRWGRIVNLGSISAYNGYANNSLYCSAKHAILGLSKALHLELKQCNIRVFCISPTGTKTRMGKQCLGTQDYSTFLNPEEVAKYIIFFISSDDELIVEEVRLNRYIQQ